MKAPTKISREERNRRNCMTFGEQMREAESSCVPCKLCGGKSKISDAGPGWGYYIECENAHDKIGRGRATCLQSGARISGWAYNVSDIWNRLNAQTGHASDCVVHNAPAYEPGPCDCGLSAAEAQP